jgi:2-polyprenyl-6-methoxyphenol hydroxylase-like FAD-dependent oxidoreductase
VTPGPAGSRRGWRLGVVGAGIGGLAAALALDAAGCQVTVVERGPGHRDQAGTGLTLWTNGVTALRHLGVGDAIATVGSPLHHFENLTADGRHIATWPVGELSRRLGAPNLSVLRGDLREVLLAAARERPALRLRFGPAVESVTPDPGGGATLTFADGSTEAFEVVVGADGVNSVVRDAVVGTRPPRYAGYPVWRGLADVGEDVVPAGVHRQLWGRGARFGFYRVGTPSQVYWWATTARAAEDCDPTAPQLKDVTALFEGFRAPVLDVLAATDEVHVLLTRVYHNPPLRHWGRGRITLLGDAAHAMTFNVGQGACQALEDAVVLGALVGEAAEAGGPPEQALRRFEAVRRPRTDPLVQRARRIGEIALWKGARSCRGRDALLRAVLNGPAVARHCADLVFEA